MSGLPMNGHCETYIRPHRGSASAPTHDGTLYLRRHRLSGWPAGWLAGDGDSARSTSCVKLGERLAVPPCVRVYFNKKLGLGAYSVSGRYPLRGRVQPRQRFLRSDQCRYRESELVLRWHLVNPHA